MSLIHLLLKLEQKILSVSRGAGLGILICSPRVKFANAKLCKTFKRSGLRTQVGDKCGKRFPYL